MNLNQQNSNFRAINIISYAIPLAVAVLLSVRTKLDLGDWTKFLPHLNAAINFCTALFLILGVISIKNGRRESHKFFMLSAFSLGAVFLVSYILYHLTNASTSFGGEGFIAYCYYFLLITHIMLAAVVVRFVLMAVYYALQSDFISHKKTVRYAFPIWLYVSVTGVVVYAMISPYYQ